MRLERLLNNSRLIALLIALLMVAGLSALQGLPRQEDPRIANRIVIISTPFPGADALRVEAQLTQPIEDKLRELPEAQHIESSSRPGLSIIRLELEPAVDDPTPVLSRARDKLADLQPRLPAGAGSPVLDADRSYAFSRLLALPATVTPLGTVSRYAEELASRLRNVPGTDYVRVYGAVPEEWHIQVRARDLSVIGLNIDGLSQQLRQSQISYAAGALMNGEVHWRIDFPEIANARQQIEQLPIQLPDGSSVALGQIAEIERRLQDPADNLTLVNGEPGVIIGVRLRPNYRIDHWDLSIEQALARFQTLLPQDLQIQTLFNQRHYTESRLGDLVANIAIGFGLIVVVLLVTLGWRAALITASALPLTVMFALFCLHLLGIPIHQTAVTGLVVALGITVDNAIVITDAIAHFRRHGHAGINAAIRAVRHYWLPLLGSTLTTMLAFTPIMLMPGSAGEFIGPIALAVICSLVGSYLISHTLIAGLAGRFLPPSESTPHWYNRGLQLPKLSAAYRTLLDICLRWPRLASSMLIMLPLSGFLLVSTLTEQFFPPADRDMFSIEVRLPAGTHIQRTQALTRSIQQYLQQHDEIVSSHWSIGRSVPSFYYNMMQNQEGQPHYAQAMVTTRSAQATEQLLTPLQYALDRHFPEAQILVRKLEQGPPFAAPIELRLVGPNLDVLRQHGEALRLMMSQLPAVVQTRTTLEAAIPTLRLDPLGAQGAVLGYPVGRIADELQARFIGVVTNESLEMTETVPLRLQLQANERDQISDVMQQPMALTNQQATPIGSLASLTLLPQPSAIPRRNGERINVVEGFLQNGVLPQSVLNQLQTQLEAYRLQLPDGYRLEIGGEAAKRDESVGDLKTYMNVIITLLIVVIVISFNSFRMSALVLLSALLSAGLGLFSVWVAGFPFGFTVIIGLLGLMGLAINASIVILAELKADPAALMGDRQAIIDNVMGCTRHITSTTITTVGGFIPLIMDPGGFWPPFAVAIAGGTALATLVSLLLIPCCYLLMARRRAFELSNTGD